MSAPAREQAAAAPKTLDEAVPIDMAFVLSKVESWVVGFQKLLPNIVVAVVVLLLVAIGAWVVERSFRRWADRHERSNLGAVLGSFLKWMILLVGGLLALTIVIPSLDPKDLLAGLGLGSVAIGFAFKDILQNWLAGLLILLQQPFKVGDQIVVGSYEGTVDWIETRATIITTYDGRRVIVPNASVYSNAVTVNNALPSRRSQFDVGIGYGDDIDLARKIIVESTLAVDGVQSEPAPEAFVWELACSSVNLRVRWWTNSKGATVVHTKASVIQAVKLALDRNGIDMPFPTQVTINQEGGAGADEALAPWPIGRQDSQKDAGHRTGDLGRDYR
jgi:small-conductance mechanosensitive channel